MLGNIYTVHLFMRKLDHQNTTQEKIANTYNKVFLGPLKGNVVNGKLKKVLKHF